MRIASVVRIAGLGSAVFVLADAGAREADGWMPVCLAAVTALVWWFVEDCLAAIAGRHRGAPASTRSGAAPLPAARPRSSHARVRSRSVTQPATAPPTNHRLSGGR
jgi:hypothetical protein